MNDKLYRKNVGLIVLNEQNQLLICRRKDQQTWQFPQGGIDAGESTKIAAYRELLEEVGILKKDVSIIKESLHWYQYDLPDKYQQRSDVMKKFKGQTQKWFLLKAKTKLTINLLNEVPQEFVAYKWVSFWYPLSHIVSFKKEVYLSVLNEFLATYIDVAND
ncbi:RNA pyrophosphohydrolase [Gammaproteobacteria bacterium]|jgi:putative (di)nucleoside polyphosphate hydrolase|nr:RNA pyrophosphohydrolase [Gammaproteobacteria bacterium]MDA7851695.1 RNA pyrophosphohydrolase [Gammaproteobacteria bacterium]MDA8925238.1 RNA pyrophosphohydrolase [Gammaproteobacteria bacterium]MDA9371327.1 RNA pyrophosphohydrolase [Gammaproteobacteria bacterium]MDA9973843.1 RNA pyrophosphohydrolase [Gammaproteobacteria bacterium]|tara:strand:+ start:5294 stop:5776 length:483 start_codon:yes stop_codon:yes gene_type:complete